MNILHKALACASVASCLFSVAAPAQTTTYDGNGGTSFGGPVGDGMLTLTNDGTTLTGTFTAGNNSNTFTAYDELVIYISTGGGAATGSNSTASFMDDGGRANGDELREAVSGYDATSTGGTVQSVVNFAPGFYANYAIALSPVGVQYSGVYGLPGSSNPGATATSFSYFNTANLTPTASAGPYTFSIALSVIGSPTSFEFATTYLDSHDTDTINRSNEAFNSVVDVSDPANTGSPGEDTVSVGENLYVVPEPGTWALLGAGALLGVGFQRRRSRV
jgi:hypothetical protein